MLLFLLKFLISRHPAQLLLALVKLGDTHGGTPEKQVNGELQAILMGCHSISISKFPDFLIYNDFSLTFDHIPRQFLKTDNNLQIIHCIYAC